MLDEKQYRTPPSLLTDEFRELLSNINENLTAKIRGNSIGNNTSRLMESLPVELRKKAEAKFFSPLKITLEAEHLDDDDDEGDLLGLYEGTPLPERYIDQEPLLPDRITLFRIPLMEMCRGIKELRREIRLTIIHELGHFFGFSEEDLEGWGYCRYSAKP